MICGAVGALSAMTAVGETWSTDTQAEWDKALVKKDGIEISDGMVSSAEKSAVISSVVKLFDKKRSVQSIQIDQSPVWLNWEPVGDIGPVNLRDAPVMLSLGEGNYWMFGKYGRDKKKGFKPEVAKLDGFDVPLVTTPFENQFTAPGGLEKALGGYHAWQSKDMVNWVHHGPVTHSKGKWMTTAEYVDGKAYFYYDFPNDQDPHLIIDDNLTDGKLGKDMGMTFKDPSGGSDCTFIRDLDGKFHVIAEDWSPIDASAHAWDSPLATHAVSPDGIGDFKILAPAVDERTNPTGRFAEFLHPHWHKEDPENYPAKVYNGEKAYHGIKSGDKAAFSRYEIHEPAQNAFGDWASISIGGQYYLFGDFEPAHTGEKKEKMSVAWFTSSSLDKQFSFCGNIGRGHPDPDVMFAEGKFYLATQQKQDFVSSGPWVDGVEVRVGVDTSNDGKIDQWSEWQEVKESYDYTPGFAKQVAKTPAKMDLSKLPEGYGFQYEVKVKNTTKNGSKPILDKVSLHFKN